MKELKERAAALGVALDEYQIAQFQAYYALLQQWNERTNLTAIADYWGVLTKHFLDSLSCVLALELPPGELRLIDVGSGAGFPGLPLKIAFPEIHLTLLEANAKKTAFLHAVVDHLHLSDVTILTARAEEAAHDPAHREAYDVAVARALAAMPVLVELCLPFVRCGGVLIAQKGDPPAAEVAAAQEALRLLGGQLGHIQRVHVPGLDAVRHLVVVDKVAATPARYPRRPGVPSRRPLGGTRRGANLPQMG
ncbi:MAG: 16S rRNA (guanine(527)-N(7))-methyltransferase RsmG [Ardenticatenia bacterium]|jgi:16S rRNA (guanine527-N7)-methyltransferase|nr:MAG: 16S rRNA (guanine(527)-N(7))-methyltransferase RsmG [Ardenticatenia bacterium]